MTKKNEYEGKSSSELFTLTTAAMSSLLTEAKRAHTFWEEAFTKQGDTVPEHTWEDWYAKFLIARMLGVDWAEAASATSKAYPEPNYKDAIEHVLSGSWGKPGANGWTD